MHRTYAQYESRNDIENILSDFLFDKITDNVSVNINRETD